MNKLTDKVMLRHGAELNDRVVMAPMVTWGGTDTGEITQEQLDYYARRSQVAGMIITEAAYVDPEGIAFKGEIGVSNDRYLPGLKDLAKTIQSHGAKAILQLHHGGREAGVYYDRGGIPVVPSQMDFPFIDYPVRQLTKEQIHTIIEEFAEATKRAIDADFDGVEIHGANHYLLQQFFSAYSNHREDEYGGTLRKRMEFELEIVDQVLETVRKYAKKDFIIGIRISPDEIHGDNVGFTYKENQAFIKELNKKDLDYVHVAGNFVKGFEYVPQGAESDITILYKEVLNPEIKLIGCGSVFSAKEAEEAVQEADLIAIAREALIEPDFAKKIHEGQEADIISEVSPEILPDLKWTKTLTNIIVKGEGVTGKHAQHGYVQALPLPNDDSIKQYQGDGFTKRF
ncbi:NADH-dependent oxidoreductase [Limosilactobacillus sp. c9Ua_26_M]|uniref:NADH-dependent oxidoreductase n=1 Tax=Limosilactobacillus urinaemulieris TaxID=2742600 RepID=A0ABR8ZLQ2_9LACO|nr:NADH-dependent oxidoreductase [Limosilactobacillus urinaemulieris]MBD8086221.1 NADH-dependent oxidoreductase [Limosilactobacillus urinaemulieris]